MSSPFIQNSDIEEELSEILNPSLFLQEMKEWGTLEEICDDYSSNVYNLCMNSVAWIIKQLLHSFYIYDLTVVEGEFRGKHHCWIEIGDCYLDLTISQFIPEAPKFAVISIEDAKTIGYYPIEKHEVQNWIAIQEQEA